jgi:PAS domain S-box-containing protein
MWKSKTNHLFFPLIIILAIDAFRTLFESVYFGFWYTSLAGIIPKSLSIFLTKPELVIIPKLINVIAAIIVIILLLKKWLPQEEKLKEELGDTLEAKDKKYKNLFELAQEGIWVVDKDNITSLVNPSVAKMLGYSPKEMIGQSMFDFMESKEVEFLKQKMAQRRKGIKDQYDFKFKHRNGNKVYATVAASPILDEEGLYQGAIAGIMDITERTNSEKKLKEGELQLRKMIERSPLPTVITDKNQDISFFNDKFTELFGYTINDVSTAEEWWLSVYPNEEYRTIVQNAWIEAIGKAEKENTDIAMQTWDIVIKDRTKRTCEFHMVPLGESSLIIMNDITERIESEKNKSRLTEQLKQTQKMEAIGTLAGGIAHDFNNMLSVIIGNLSYAISELNPDKEMLSSLLDAQEGSKQAQKLTQQLLTFSKGGEPIKYTHNINLLVKESSEFILRGSKSKCTYDLTNDQCIAEVDTGQINQVISNIVINANQAMPNGGEIFIKTKLQLIEDNENINLITGRYVVIIIKDQGIGISDEFIPNIFDPYFTTKQKGNGLGLASSYSIIKKHFGDITVSSELGSGTEFNIFIPASSKNSPERLQEEDYVHTGNGKILIMDDQEPILKMTKKVLSKMGYETNTATNGEQAVKAYLKYFKSEAPFDLVILDLTIPGGMGGFETMQELIKIDPNVKAIVSSGYSHDPIMANFKEHGFIGVIPKPFTRSQLAQVLNDIFEDKKVS